MSTNNITSLLEQVAREFPDISDTLSRISDIRLDQKLETLADTTTLAFDRGHIKKAKAQLNFVLTKMDCATLFEQEFIAEHYVKHLFWQASERAIEEGWPKLPSGIKKKYLELHGAPPG